MYCLNHLGTGRSENTVPLLLFNCYLAELVETTAPLLLFAGLCVATSLYATIHEHWNRILALPNTQLELYSYGRMRFNRKISTLILLNLKISVTTAVINSNRYIIYNLGTNNSVEESHSWKANNRSSSQEIRGRLWKSTFRHRIQLVQPLIPILGQINLIRIAISFKIHFKIILPSVPRSESNKF